MYDEIVIARHVGADPDAVASTISLRDSIKLTFPKKKVYAVGNPVSRFKYFGALDKLAEKDYSSSLLIVLDVPNLHRIEGVDPNQFKDILKIDHHPKENDMGSVEWIDITASSTCQMIIELILNTNLRLDKKIAENLFLGVVSDSDRFMLGYTSPETFDLVSLLIKKTKIDFTSLYPLLYTRPLSEIKYYGFIANNLVVTENKLAYIKIKSEDIEKYGVDSGTASNMVNDFNNISDFIAWVFISYDAKDDIYKANIRSRGPIINEIASSYNGGGHNYASGARIKNKDDVDKLINELDDACKEYLKNENK